MTQYYYYYYFFSKDESEIKKGREKDYFQKKLNYKKKIFKS